MADYPTAGGKTQVHGRLGVASLAGLELSNSVPGTDQIVLDADAAEWGWYGV